MKQNHDSIGLRARRKPALGALQALPASGEKSDFCAQSAKIGACR